MNVWRKIYTEKKWFKQFLHQNTVATVLFVCRWHEQNKNMNWRARNVKIQFQIQISLYRMVFFCIAMKLVPSTIPYHVHIVQTHVTMYLFLNHYTEHKNGRFGRIWRSSTEEKKMDSFSIPIPMIGHVIGRKGSNINSIKVKFGVNINISKWFFWILLGFLFFDLNY